MGTVRTETPEIGDKVCEWIERNVPLVGDDYGRPIKLRPWQREVLTKVFGTLDKDGRRTIRTVYIQLPRKSAKTFLAALIILVCLVAEKKSDQELYTGSWTSKQSDRLFRYLCSIIGQSKWLSARTKINRGLKEITFLPRNNTYKALSGSPEAGQSISPSVMVVDELWMFRGVKGRELHEGLTSGFAARREPLLVIITTAGRNKNTVCWEEYQYAKGVQSGKIDDPKYLPILYELDEEDDPFLEANWYKASPALGDYVSLEEYRMAADRAKRSPTEKAKFLQFFLNRWVDSSYSWISRETWDACEVEYTSEELKGKKCYGGFDYGLTRDLCSFTLLFPIPGGKYRVLTWAWVARGTITERVQQQDHRYQDWLDSGLLRVTEGNATDHDTIQKEILDICKQYNVRWIGADPYACGETIKIWKSKGLRVYEWRQSNLPAISAAAKYLDSAILNKRLEHNGNELLTWAVTNATVKIDCYDNLKPLKACDGGRVDPLITLVMSLGVAIASKKVATPSVSF